MTCFKVVITPAWPSCFYCPVAQGILSAILILIFFSFSLIFWNILGKNTSVFSSVFTPVQRCKWSATVSSEGQQHRVGVGATGKPKPPVRNVICGGGFRRLPSYCLGSLLHISAGPDGCKITSKDTRVVWWWKAAPGLPLSWIYWALSWRVFANGRFWLAVCSIAKVVYLLLKWILSFRFYVWVKDKDLAPLLWGHCWSSTSEIVPGELPHHHPVLSCIFV